MDGHVRIVQEWFYRLKTICMPTDIRKNTQIMCAHTSTIYPNLRIETVLLTLSASELQKTKRKRSFFEIAPTGRPDFLYLSVGIHRPCEAAT